VGEGSREGLREGASSLVGASSLAPEGGLMSHGMSHGGRGGSLEVRHALEVTRTTSQPW